MAVCMRTCIHVCVCHWAVHNGSRAAARACGMVSESYDVTCGVRQGCIRYQHFLIFISMLSSICHWTVTECRTNVLKLPIFMMPILWGTVGSYNWILLSLTSNMVMTWPCLLTLGMT